jgi:response regulator of citrate/malate metabolism
MAEKLTDERKAEVKVLVVDDVPSARKVTVRMLARIGFKNFIECNGITDSIEHLKNSNIDLLVSDIHLKDGLGTDLIKMLDGTDRLQYLRTIFITSDLDKKELLESLDCRAMDYLLKPFSPTALEEKIASLWSI